MKPRWLIAVTLVGAVVVLPVLAHVSLPDPVWIHGVYDDADYDDVVVSITSAVGATAPLPLCDTSLVLVVVASASQAPEGSALALGRSSEQTRSPPASSCFHTV